MCFFPREVIEKILYFCDGKTLKKAKLVNSDWHCIVEYLTQKTDVWEKCCNDEIPQTELNTYLSKYEDIFDEDKWVYIYDNWSSWHDVEKNVHFDTTLCPVDIPRITCIAVSGIYIAVGCEDGRVHFYSNDWELLYSTRYLSAKIIDLGFVEDNYKMLSGSDNPLLLIAYNEGTIVITDFDGKLTELESLHDVKLFNIYKNYVCYEKRGGRISVVKLHRDLGGKLYIKDVSYVRIYSPTELSCMHVCEEVATFLLHNEVKVMKYKTPAPIFSLEHKASITFTIKNYYRLQRLCRMYQNNIILSLCCGEDIGNQFLELFILGDNGTCSQKLFNSWEVFNSNITCMFVYGNIFVIGDDTGCIYFYHVPLWRSLDLRTYDKKLIIGKHPIIGIDVIETKLDRTFYALSSFDIHKVVCYRTHAD